MLVNFSDREMHVIKELAAAQDISEEKVVILALRYYQWWLHRLTYSPKDSPAGCGPVE